MFPFACMPLVLWGVVRLVVSSLANVLTISSCAYLPNGIRVASQTHSIQASLLGARWRISKSHREPPLAMLVRRCLGRAGCYLVDPASLFDGIYYSDNPLVILEANSATNPEHTEGMHLLDKKVKHRLCLLTLMIHDKRCVRIPCGLCAGGRIIQNFCPINFRW
ncbi:hypothetical protein HKD37_U058446 [Glycine soja]